MWTEDARQRLAWRRFSLLYVGLSGEAVTRQVIERLRKKNPQPISQEEALARVSRAWPGV